MTIFTSAYATEAQRQTARDVFIKLLSGDTAGAAELLGTATDELSGKALSSFIREANGLNKAINRAADSMAYLISASESAAEPAEERTRTRKEKAAPDAAAAA